MALTLYTIGFTRTSAARFFGALGLAGVRRLLDVRLRNTSQLAGFAKRDDLAFFVAELLDGEYQQEPLLAPTAELLTAYRGRQLDWPSYSTAFVNLLVERQIEQHLPRHLFAGPTALLCSEASADRCHRRLAAEHLAAIWDDLEIIHL
jgi:uncharacterized protein (DUF488 family)